MKRLFFILSILSLCISSCNNLTETKQEDVALQAAKVYYDQLLHGDYNSFVGGSLKGITVPADYKEQLVTNAQMYVEQLKEDHQGIDKIEKVKATCDSVNRDLVTANAYLTVYFKDNTKEEILVPMIRKNNIWYLR